MISCIFTPIVIVWSHLPWRPLLFDASHKIGFISQLFIQEHKNIKSRHKSSPVCSWIDQVFMIDNQLK